MNDSRKLCLVFFSVFAVFGGQNATPGIWSTKASTRYGVRRGQGAPKKKHRDQSKRKHRPQKTVETPLGSRKRTAAPDGARARVYLCVYTCVLACTTQKKRRGNGHGLRARLNIAGAGNEKRLRFDAESSPDNGTPRCFDRDASRL